MNRFETNPSASRRRVSLQVDPSALIHNLACVRRYCPDSKVFAVLKADAYGHGGVACAGFLSSAGSDGFAVAFPGEAVALREAGIREPILVLQGASTHDEVRLACDQELWLVIHDLTQLKLLQDLPGSAMLNVWVKVDTGMSRMGLSVSQLRHALTLLTRHRQIQLVGVMSHFSCADQPRNPHTKQQIAAFNELRMGPLDGSITSQQNPHIYRSLANSAGVLAWPGTGYDWIRPGIMLYGANPLLQAADAPSKPEESLSLRPAMQVTAPLVALRFNRRGDGIGYGQSYQCPEDMSVGHVAIGYGDGLPRSLIGAKVRLRNREVPVIGRVSMDSIALDLRGLQAAVGDSVTIWGKDNPVEQLAHAASTISYDLLCSIRGSICYQSHQRSG